MELRHFKMTATYGSNLQLEYSLPRIFRSSKATNKARKNLLRSSQIRGVLIKIEKRPKTMLPRKALPTGVLC